jgi:hypothetical protein
MLDSIDFSARAQRGVFADVRISGHPSLAVRFFFFSMGTVFPIDHWSAAKY